MKYLLNIPSITKLEKSMLMMFLKKVGYQQRENMKIFEKNDLNY